MELHRIMRPTEVVQPYARRVVLIPHAVIGFLVGIGPFADADALRSPAFDAVFQWAAPKTWGLGFLIACALATWTLLTASWRTYRAANILTLCLSSAWLASLMDARWHLGIVVSYPALGLWAFVVATCAIIAWMPTPVRLTRERRDD